MKVSDHIQMKNQMPKRKARDLGEIQAMILTHERPGMLSSTIQSLRKTTSIPLTVIDDGSISAVKKAELDRIESSGMKVVRLPKSGFVESWVQALGWARSTMQGVGGLVLLEDDLSFANGWLDILRRMYEGAADTGLMPGAMSCLRANEDVQSAIVDLRGVKAYQSMWHSFQVNLLPWEVIANETLIWQAAEETKRGKHGLDVYLLGLISDRMGRTNFMSVESWVAHEGAGRSLVASQGYLSLQHRGCGLVEELRK